MIHFDDHSAGDDPDNPGAYLKEMLQLNPMVQSGTIIRRRRRWCDSCLTSTADAANNAGRRNPKQLSFRQRQRSTSAPLSPEELDRLRVRASRYLDRLHKQFYSLPAETLDKYIKLLHHDQLPEFAERAERLRQVARHRKAILEFALVSDDQIFAETLQQALIAPVAVASQIWEQYIDSMISAKRVKQRAKRVQRFVNQYPAIYQLDRAWFDELLCRRNRRDWKRSYSFSTRLRNLIGNRAFQVIVLLIAAVIMLVAAVSDLDSSPSPSRRQPSNVRPAFKLKIPKASDLPKMTLPTPRFSSPRPASDSETTKPPDPVNRLPEGIDLSLPSREIRKAIEKSLQGRRRFQPGSSLGRSDEPASTVHASDELRRSNQSQDEERSRSGAANVSD